MVSSDIKATVKVVHHGVGAQLIVYGHVDGQRVFVDSVYDCMGFSCRPELDEEEMEECISAVSKAFLEDNGWFTREDFK